MQKQSTKYAYVPEGFNPEEFLPKKLAGFADDAKFFLHKIYEQRVFGKRGKADFIPLKAAYLRKIISYRNYQAIRNTLLQSNVIETDNHYIKGQKATGYRLGPRFRDSKHKKVPITNKRLIKNIQLDEQSRHSELELDVHQHLYRHLQKLEIDFEHAITELDDDDFVNNSISIEMIRDGNFFFIPDNYGRVHTNLTNLKGSLRKYLKVGGEGICEIDIVNSQPFFFGIVLSVFMRRNNLISFNLRSPFKEGEMGDILRMNSLNSSNSSLSLSPPSLPCDISTNGGLDFLHEIEFMNSLNSSNSSLSLSPPSLPCDISTNGGLDAMKYLELVQSGNLYEYLANKFAVAIDDRKRFKVKFFAEIFFCRNSWKSKYKQMFQKEFPTVYWLVQELKKKDYTALSKLLQKVESSFIINKVVRRIMNINPEIFVSTIHDSLLIHPNHAGLAEQIITQEFGAWGLVPTLKRK